MKMRLRLIEPEVQPSRVEVSVAPGEAVRLYALGPKMAWAGLRSTVVRIGEHLPPPDSIFIGSVHIREDHNGQPRVHLDSVGALVEVHHELDHGRTGTRPPEVLEPDGWLTVSLPDLRTVRLALRLVFETVQGADATVGGSGTRRSRVVRGDSGIAWLVPTVWTIYTDHQQYLLGNLRALGKRLGLGPRSIQGIFIFAGFAAASGYTIWNQRGARVDAETAAESAHADATRANDAMQAALRAEQVCLTERRDIAEELGQQDAARKILADRALTLALAESIARDLGGARFSTPELVARSEPIAANLSEAVSMRMAAIDINPDKVKPCLSAAEKWSDDLPVYALLWHPDPEQMCPSTYVGFENNVTMVGRWGLSTRVAEQHGASLPTDTPLQASVVDLDRDPRHNDRWSVATLAGGLRATQDTVLTTGDARRATVWPQEAQLWSLAFFDATNRLARVAEGALDEKHQVCIDAAVRALGEQRGVLVPGEPLLPSIVDVADGGVELSLSATPGCPWPDGVLQDSADAALIAVARWAVATDVASDVE
jgi:multidrug efflux pump subunit AcrA (membrane-fusion protein)